jgi:hypothetical protein
MGQPLPGYKCLERGERRQRGARIGPDQERATLFLQDRGDERIAARPESTVRGFPESAQPLVG